MLVKGKFYIYIYNKYGLVGKNRIGDILFKIYVILIRILRKIYSNYNKNISIFEKIY